MEFMDVTSKMKKKVLGLLMTGIMVMSLAACGGSNHATTAEGDTEGGAKNTGQKIGLCMPTQSAERWINDANNMKKRLEEKGYKVSMMLTI